MSYILRLREAFKNMGGSRGGTGVLDPPHWNCQIINFCHVENFRQTPSGNLDPAPHPLRKFSGSAYAKSPLVYNHPSKPKGDHMYGWFDLGIWTPHPLRKFSGSAYAKSPLVYNHPSKPKRDHMYGWFDLNLF